MHRQICFKGKFVTGALHKYGKSGGGKSFYCVVCFQCIYSFRRNTQCFICNSIIAEIHILNRTTGIQQIGKALQSDKDGNAHNKRKNRNECSATPTFQIQPCVVRFKMIDFAISFSTTFDLHSVARHSDCRRYTGCVSGSRKRSQESKKKCDCNTSEEHG